MTRALIVASNWLTPDFSLIERGRTPAPLSLSLSPERPNTAAPTGAIGYSVRPSNNAQMAFTNCIHNNGNNPQ